MSHRQRPTSSVDYASKQDIDFNIENYNLDDILNLFKVPKDFDEEHMVQAKKIVLKMHPDKSRLPPEYFLFYSKAYKKLYSVWQFKTKSRNAYHNMSKEEVMQHYEELSLGLNEKYERDQEIVKQRQEKLNMLFNDSQRQDKEKFGKWFNEQFEKHRFSNEEERGGYGDWLRSNEDVEDISTPIAQSQMGEAMEQKKKQVRSLVVHQGVSDLYMNSSVYGSTLGGDAPESYSSGLFSSLQYEDLRKAHVESVVPVTMDDYERIPKFKNVNDYTEYRATQMAAPLSEKQAFEYLSMKSRLEDIQTTERAYKLAKQYEESKKINKHFWGSLMQLENE